MPDITYEEILELLTAKARGGSVSAMVALERALRPHAGEPDLDDELERLLERDDED